MRYHDITWHLEEQITSTVFELIDYIDHDNDNCAIKYMVAQLLTAELNASRIGESFRNYSIEAALFGDHQDYVNKRMAEMAEIKEQLRLEDQQMESIYQARLAVRENQKK